MTGLIRYPGGKSTFMKKILADRIALYNDRRTGKYIEPFYGGGHVGHYVLKSIPLIDMGFPVNGSNIDNPSGLKFDLIHHPDYTNQPKPEQYFTSMWVNDYDCGMYALWYSLVHYPEDLIQKIANFMPTLDDWQPMFTELEGMQQKQPITKDEFVHLAFLKLAVHRMSYSGMGLKAGGPIGGNSKEKQEKATDKIHCRWAFKSMIKYIDNFHDIVGGVHEFKVTNLDFEELIDAAEEGDFIYLDPPYYDKGGECYVHAFGHEEHDRLANALKRAKCPWVLSYDACDDIRNLYNWADIEEFSMKYTMSTTKKNEDGSAGKKPEKLEALIYPKGI